MLAKVQLSKFIHSKTVFTDKVTHGLLSIKYTKWNIGPRKRMGVLAVITTLYFKDSLYNLCYGWANLITSWSSWIFPGLFQSPMCFFVSSRISVLKVPIKVLYEIGNVGNVDKNHTAFLTRTKNYQLQVYFTKMTDNKHVTQLSERRVYFQHRKICSTNHHCWYWLIEY